jgi:hypothetical protein
LVVGGGELTTTLAVALFVVSWTLVAVTVTVWGADGAVNTPLVEIVPAEAAHVTALEKFAVPATVAVQVDIALVKMGVWQAAVTLVIEGAAVTATVATPLFVGSSTLVVVTVTV